jgi:p-hydroxybenzoate 3-monooxygenase
MKNGHALRAQVGIVGAGPAGLLLARILQLNGIDSIVLERRSREYVLARVRAGVLEQGTVDTLIQYGAGERLQREGLRHKDIQIRWNGERHDIPVVDENGRSLTTYGQAKIVEDLIRLRESDGLPIHFEAEVTAFEGLTDRPVIHFRHDGSTATVACDFIAGCDGYLGVSRSYVPGSSEKSYLKEYPFAWFGVLADAAPHEEIRGFAHSRRGLAVASARSKAVSRHYLQVPPDFDIESMNDDAIWNELDSRLDAGTGHCLNRGRITEKSVARLRGFVCEAMQYGKLCLAGDSAHIVPPSGAKGLNLAVGDVRVLAETIRRLLKHNDSSLLDQYSGICLRRIWPTVQWSCAMSETLHYFPNQTEFETRTQFATMARWVYTEAGRAYFREAMLGLPFEM